MLGCLSSSGVGLRVGEARAGQDESERNRDMATYYGCECRCHGVDGSALDEACRGCVCWHWTRGGEG